MSSIERRRFNAVLGALGLTAGGAVYGSDEGHHHRPPDDGALPLAATGAVVDDRDCRLAGLIGTVFSAD